jgi:hypothetical protein
MKVDDDEAFEWAQRRQGLLQPGQAPGVFQVEVIEGIGGDELPGQGCLPALARPQERHHATALERDAKAACIRFAIDHTCNLTP